MLSRLCQAKHLLLLLCLTTKLTGESSVQVQGGRHYRVVALPLKPAFIANSGDVIGTAGNHRAATWSEARGLQFLPAVQGFAQSEVRRSNRSGQIVGFEIGSDSDSSLAFVYTNTKVTVLPGRHSKAYAINDSRQIVGESSVKGKKPVSPVLWQNGTVIDLGGCCSGVARGINNHGQVVGDMYDQEGRYRAFLWEHARGIRYFGQPDSYSSAIAINDSGHVLLQEPESGVFLYLAEGKRVPMEVPKGLPADPRALNNTDVIVGAFGLFSDVYRAFIWDEKHGFHDLNDLIAARSGWKLETATGINDLGQIVGVGDHNGDEDAGFLLVAEDSDPKKSAEHLPDAGSSEK
jgi:probable HAF family extracellular repeat protein